MHNVAFNTSRKKRRGLSRFIAAIYQAWLIQLNAVAHTDTKEIHNFVLETVKRTESKNPFKAFSKDTRRSKGDNTQEFFNVILSGDTKKLEQFYEKATGLNHTATSPLYEASSPPEPEKPSTPRRRFS